MSLPESVSERKSAETVTSVEFYENRVSALLEQLHEEERTHNLLLCEKENRIQELQDAMDSSKTTRIDPVEESRSMLLEERIVEMTIMIEEKDRRIFHLQSEIDKLKEQIFALRTQVDRIPELENTINTLDNTLAGIRALSAPTNPIDDDAVSSSDDGSEADISEKPEDEFVMELRAKISSLETTIMDLDRIVVAMRAEKESMTTERDSAMESLRQREEQFRMEMEDVMRTHATEMRVNDETITNLREKIFTLQDRLEVAEMAKISLTTELEMEQARRMALLDTNAAQTAVSTETKNSKPEMISRPVSPLPMLTETIPTIVAPTPVMASPEVVAVSTVTPRIMSPKIVSPKIMSPEKVEEDMMCEIETEGGSILTVSEQVKAVIERQREQIEELNFELIALRLKVAEEMVSPNNKRILTSGGDSSKSTPSDQFVVPHRDLVPPLSPRAIVSQQPVSPPAAGCTGCFPSMFRKQKHYRNILV